MVPWLTFRGLHTDRLEGFSAGHWLTFRGLPAEGLGDRSREAASFPTHHVGTAGVLCRRRPQDGLVSAGRRDSSPRGRFLGLPVARSFLISDFRKNTASLAVGRTFSVVGLLVGVRRTTLVRLSASIPMAGGASSLAHATRRGNFLAQGSVNYSCNEAEVISAASRPPILGVVSRMCCHGSIVDCFQNEKQSKTPIFIEWIKYDRKQQPITNSIMLADWSAHSQSWVSPSSGRQPNAVWRWHAQGHTHSALGYLVQLQTSSSLFGGGNSLWGSFRLFHDFLGVFLPPCL